MTCVNCGGTIEEGRRDRAPVEAKFCLKCRAQCPKPRAAAWLLLNGGTNAEFLQELLDLGAAHPSLGLSSAARLIGLGLRRLSQYRLRQAFDGLPVIGDDLLSFAPQLGISPTPSGDACRLHLLQKLADRSVV